MNDLPTIEVPGGRVEYDDVAGDPDLPPLLFLHEGLGSVGLWRGFHRTVAAAAGRRAVAYSRLGHGFSDPPTDRRTPRFMHEEATEVLPVLCAELGIDHPVLVGHSDGASIALLYATAADVAATVVMAPHVFVEEIGLAGIVAARAEYVDGDLRARMARHHRDPDAAFWNWNDVWLDPAFRQWDIREALVGITCPVLAVQGTADRYGTVAHVEAIRDGAGHADVELMIVDGGHAPHLEHADDVVHAVLNHLGH